MKILIAAAFAATLALAAGAAQAGDPAPSRWGDQWDGRTANEQSLDLGRAIASKTAQERGYGPSISTLNSTTNIGQEDNFTTIQGDSISSGATNSINSTSTSTVIGNNANNVIVSTRGNQISGSASQNATAQATTTDANGQSTVTATTRSTN